MESVSQFNVFVKRKIPYLTSFLWWVTLIFFLGVALLYIIMAPTDKASSEMATAYYILFVPDIIKTIGVCSILGLLIFFPLYNRAKRSMPAIFSFDEENIYIKGGKVNVVLKRKMIKDIYFNDLSESRWWPKEQIQVVFKGKNRKMTSFFLADYSEAGHLMDVVSNLKNGTISFYDRSFDTDEE